MRLSNISTFNVRTLSEDAIDPIVNKALEPRKTEWEKGDSEKKLLDYLRENNLESEYRKVIQQVNQNGKLSDIDRLVFKYLHAEYAVDILKGMADKDKGISGNPDLEKKFETFIKNMDSYQENQANVLEKISESQLSMSNAIHKLAEVMEQSTSSTSSSVK